jgi:ATP-dependent Lon protease
MEKTSNPENVASAEVVELPVLPLRDVVVYPHMVIPLFVGREKSVRALDMAMAGDKRILLVAQRSPDIDDPQAGELYSIGTVATARSRYWSRAPAAPR